MIVPFNKPPYIGNEDEYVLNAMKNDKISGNGEYTKKCQTWFEKKLQCKKALLTTSCTHALEMAAILLNIKEGDEIIMPSYTFVSTANAFVLRGAKIIFIDIEKNTLNIDETKIEEAITSQTKAIVVVHYAGVACEMDTIMQIAQKYNIFVIEDAAQAMLAKYEDRYLGTIGHLGTFSFHETKNFTSAGEGGLLIINDENFIQRADILREKGTNRSAFFRGEVDKYSWVDIGSSYLLNDVSAAYLYGELQEANVIINFRLNAWHYYYKNLLNLSQKYNFTLPNIPNHLQHNAHIFYIITDTKEERTTLLQYLRNHKIEAVFHYIPLHSSTAGKKYGDFYGTDTNTSSLSQRIIRLPLFYGLTTHQQDIIIDTIRNYYEN